jgi:aspartyl-tRNA(Asn)/glutamyl-tRNA(Gln) amidotransferase subunit B
MSSKYNLNHEQISFLLNNKELKELFLATIKLTSDHKQAYNLISTNIKTIVDENQNALNFINSENLSYLINAIANGGISNKVARDVMLEIIKTNDDPKIIIEKNNWGQISDEKIILEQIKIVLSQNQQSIIDFKNGKDKALGFLNGQVLKAFKGKGNPNIVSKLMLEELNRS